MLGEKAFRYLTTKPKRFNILHGSVRSSKTTNAMLALPERAAKAPHGDIVITGKTERTAYRNIIRPLQEMYGPKRVKYLKGTAEGTINGRDFYVLGGNNEAAVTKAQGLTVAYWHADEAVTYPQAFTDMMVTRLSPEGACSDLTMNPSGPYHPLKTEFIDNGELLESGELAAWHFTLDDNPNLSESYIRSLKALYSATSLFYKRYILGLWVYAEGAIYDFFDESEHRLKLEPPESPDQVDVALDYGTSNATAAGLFYSWRTGKSYLRRTYYHSGRETGRSKTDSEYADELEDWWRGERLRYVIIDPSAASFKAELRKRGYNVKDAKNDRLDGIRTHATLLKSGKFAIGPDSSNDQVVRDYGAYLWDAKAQDKGEDKPMKGADDGSHTMDSIRYYLFTLHRTRPAIGSVRKPKRF